MYARREREQALIASLRDLSDGRLAEVEDFVDFLRAREEHRELAQAAAILSNGTEERALSETKRPTEADELVASQRDGVARLNAIYERYVKPVEQDHWGEYVVVTPDGHMVFDADLMKLMEQTDHMRDEDNCPFKVGPISAANIL